MRNTNNEEQKTKYLATEEAFNKYSEKIFAFAFSLTGDADEARDITAETFFKLLSEPRVTEPDFMVKPWLFKVAANLSKNFMMRFIRRILRLPNYLIDVLSNSSSDVQRDVLRNEEFGRLEKAMRKLDETDRRILYLKYFEEMSYKEIGEITEVPEGTVASRLSRALGRLSNEFGPE